MIIGVDTQRRIAVSLMAQLTVLAMDCTDGPFQFPGSGGVG